MTATVAERPALTDLKDCVTRLLLDLATLTTLSTYDCKACPDSLTSMCAHHLAQTATLVRVAVCLGAIPLRLAFASSAACRASHVL